MIFRIEELDIDIPVFTHPSGHALRRHVLVIAPSIRSSRSWPRELLTTGGTRLREGGGRPPVTDPRRSRQGEDGVFAGHFVTNPVNDERLPLWVSDYVLMEYGTGRSWAFRAR